ncbi:DUF397 domain-containing protein [Streptomyces turgidiscabies]|uniref:Putative toxin-antitoxin system, toxin component n=1 Tax=Streptomyces turgidiscabies (strain Car8) TaxID=698760 RepID=L7FFJ8_STRT8|nr:MULTISPECIES: DUF397 domain-containing protein [Streptomyces]ELP69866.1 putative toxin-antitoxin system, toxin component [Streptomyces turgidiscabies Car8]MDX3492334.1 DUF397 domain-containing protein [Streptomyces turgidiscabies]GAQ69374.1 hypothetical protein T45_01098 [Streptomyces turgidiscabies]
MITSSDPEGLDWIKSSYSNNGGNCIEVSGDLPGVVPVRDSKIPHGPILVASEPAWGIFVEHIKH